MSALGYKKPQVNKEHITQNDMIAALCLLQADALSSSCEEHLRVQSLHPGPFSLSQALLENKKHDPLETTPALRLVVTPALRRNRKTLLSRRRGRDQDTKRVRKNHSITAT